MLRRSYRMSTLICFAVLLTTVSPGATWLAHARQATYSATAMSNTKLDFIPLPGSCGRGLPPGTDVPACCIFGYVVIGGQAVAGAKVTLTSPHGQSEIWTEIGPDSPQPYYRLSLSDPPLSAQTGETITITAEYSSHRQTLNHITLGGGQQVDIVLPRHQPDDYMFERQIWQQAQPGQFNKPSGIAVDGAGAIYIVDNENARVQVFNSSGQFLQQWGTLGSQPGQFSSPFGIAVDRVGHVYVADTYNHRIQKFTDNGTWLASWGRQGSGDGQFSSPGEVGVDGSGNVYVTDGNNDRIQKFTSNGIFLTKWGSQGSGDGQFNGPAGVSVDNNGNVYIVDGGNHRVQKFTSNGIFLTKWGSQGGGDGQFSHPSDVSVDSDNNVYVVDTMNGRIQKFTSNGAWLASWPLSAGNEQVFFLGRASVDNSGNIYASDSLYNRIQKFTSNGVWLASWGSSGSTNGHFNYPGGVSLDRSGSIFVADTGANNVVPGHSRIQKFTNNGTFLTQWGSLGRGDGQFQNPQRVSVDRNGNVYVADINNHRIQKFTGDGTFLTKWGSLGSGNGQFVGPSAVHVDSSDNIYVTDRLNHRIQKFTSSGTFLTQWGSLGSGDGQLRYPSDVSVDSDGNVYVVDSQNSRIQKFTSDGVFLTKWGSSGSGNGQFSGPQGIGIDRHDNIYIADTGNDRIQKFTSDGVWLASWASFGSDDGQLSTPRGVSIDGDGTIYVADAGNDRIQLFRPLPAPQPIATIVSAEPRTATQGQEVALRGTGAVDAPNTIAAYAWFLDQSPTPFATTPSATLATAALALGRHSLTFQVRDSTGQLSVSQSIGIDVLPVQPSAPQSWTFLLYLAGDNGLAAYFSLTDSLGALYRLKHSPANSNVTVVALVDGDHTAGDTIRYTLRFNGQLTQEPLGETNMGDPQTLVDFVRWGQHTAPADHYYLALADHANALDGMAWDRTTSLEEHLTNSELRQALAAITDNGAHPLDVLHLDGCLMGLLENAYQVRGQARYLVSSENLVWSAFAYEAYRPAVGMTTGARALATAVVDRYAQRVGGEHLPYTIAALDLEQVDNTARATDALARELLRYALASAANRTTLANLRNQVQTFDANGDLTIATTDDYIDLADWAALVQGGVGDSSVQQAAGNLRQALTQFVVRERHASGVYRGHLMTFNRAYGVAIYYPSQPSARVYQNYVRGGLTFPTDTWWDEYLAAGLAAQPFALIAPQAHPIAPLPLVPPYLLPIIRR